MPYARLHSPFPGCLQEKLLSEAGVPVPPGAGAKKSFSVKPPAGCVEGAASLGILCLDCTCIGCLCSRSGSWIIGMHEYKMKNIGLRNAHYHMMLQLFKPHDQIEHHMIALHIHTALHTLRSSCQYICICIYISLATKVGPGADLCDDCAETWTSSRRYGSQQEEGLHHCGT